MEEIDHALTVLLTTVAGMILAAGTAGAEEKRVATENVGGHYLEFWKSYFQGQWTARVVGGEDSGRIAVGNEGTWSCQLAPTENSVLMSGTINGKPDSNGIGGVDASANVWREVFFMGDGGHLTQFYRAKPADLLGDPAGKVIRGKAKYIHADGGIDDSDIAVSIVDRDIYEYAATNRHNGEEKLPDLRAVYKRKK